MDLDQEQIAVLACENPRCRVSLLDAGVDLVDTNVTVSTHYRIYDDGTTEAVSTDNDANDENETSLRCGTCGHVVHEDARELLEELFNFGT